jgi:pimeloyl-ACP methyl ester carboxylesterase
MYAAAMTATYAGPAPLVAESAGAGDTVLVLIHGFPLTSAMWRPQIDGLASDALRVAAPDLPGFGRTPGAMTSVEECADQIDALMMQIGARRVVLAGFSMGGYVALAFVRKYASRLHGLILVDTKAEPDSDEAKQGRYALAERVRAEGEGIVIDAMLPRLVSEATLAGHPDVVQQVRDAASGATRDGIVGALGAIAERPSSVDVLPGIAVPVLVLVGRDDVITPVADGERMASAIPDAKLVIIAGAGHMTPLEQAAAVNASIQAWLATVL